MVLSCGNINPGFSYGIQNYTANVGYDTSSITITPTAEDSTATITVNGKAITSGQASEPINLNVGSNTIALQVTPFVGEPQIYTVTVIRASSPYLTDIIVDGVSSFTYNKKIFNYDLTLSIDATAITPIAEDSNATISINCINITSGQKSALINLKPGNNIITIQVIPAKGIDQRTYTMTVYRANCQGIERYWNYKTFDLGKASTANINLSNGGLILSATDFALPGRGIPLTMGRYYNSLTGYKGMLGYGWQTTFESFLELNGKNVVVYDPDGSRHNFTYVSDTNFTPPAGEYRKVIVTNGAYTVIEKNGTQYHYGIPVDNIAKLQSVEDRFGNTLTLIYTDSLLTSVTEASGRVANFAYTQIEGKNYLYRITFTPSEGSNDSRYIQYGYTGTNLTTVSYPAINNAADIEVKYEYDPDLGLLNLSKVTYNNSEKNKTSFSYKTSSWSISKVTSQFSTYGDFKYSVSGEPTNLLSVSYSFDYDGNKTTLTDPNGAKYVYTHNDTGQCISLQMPLCNNPIVYSYDSNYNLLTTDQVKNVYDPATNAETSRNVTTAYEYDENGNLLSITNDKGYKNLITTIQYNDAHRYVLTDISSITDAGGNITRYTNTYNTEDKLTALTIASPKYYNVASTSSEDYQIIHTFDTYGQRITKDVQLATTSASKCQYQYGYSNGMLTALTNAYGTTTYDYTVYGECKTVTDANSVQVSYGIDPRTGNLTSIAAPVNTQGQFDAYNTISGPRFSYTYDANNNKTSQTDAKNNTTLYSYDELNHLYRVRSAYLANGTCYYSYLRYDINGNLVQNTDYKGYYTSYEYDALNRKTKTIDINGKIEEELGYDEADRVIMKYDGKRNYIKYYYDSVDNLLCSQYYEGNVLKYIISFTYDKNGNVLTKSAPLSSQDETGTIETRYWYKPTNQIDLVRITCATNSIYNQEVSYFYEAGQLIEMHVGAPWAYYYHYSYDAAQRIDTILCEPMSESGQKIKFEYYPGGQRKRKKIYNNQTDSDLSPFMTVDYQYDTAYRLKNLNYQWSSYYLKLGYTYNELDKITSNNVKYNVNAPKVYDYIGDQYKHFNPTPGYCVKETLKKDAPFYKKSFIKNSYSYDNLGRMASSTVYGIIPKVDMSEYTSDDPWDIDTYVSETSNSYKVDANGNPLSIKSSVDYQSNASFPSVGDDDFSQDLTYNNLNYVTKYNINNNYDSLGFAESYHKTPSYDANGNVYAEKSDPGVDDNNNYSYGLDNQMLYQYRNSNPGYLLQNITTKQYSYELDGRLLRIRSKITDKDFNDPNSPYIGDKYWKSTVNYDDYFYYNHDGVVAEVNDSTEFKNFNRLGSELISCSNSDWHGNRSVYYYLQDIRGNVMMLVDSGGDVSAIRDYDDAGRMTSQAPRHRDPFGFIGGLDAGGGLWKLGARFYDSEKRSFIQQDRYLGDPNDPLSLNRYVYCGLDPVNYVDPTGFMYTEALAATTWELNSIPVWGTVAYIAIVGGSAITEYGPLLLKIAEMGGDAAQGNGGSSGGSSGSNLDPKNIFRSIKQSPNYPEGFKAVQNGTQKYNITNKGLLEKLRDIEPGNWQKVYKDGFDAAGNKVSIHYFESQSGQVFDVATKSGWSNF